MAEHDKLEPFWTRPLRLRRRTAAPGSIPPPPDLDPPEPPPKPEPPGAPQEPSFGVTSAARRNTIAGLIADQADAEAEGEKRREAGGWVYLTDADAARHRLFGVGGWLVLIALLICVGLLRAMFELIDFWATTDHGGLAAWIMAVLRSGMALWAALILGLLIGRSGAFPSNFVAYSMVNVIYLGLFGLAFAHLTNNMVFAGVAAGVVVTLIAIAYVLRSRRVNVTFRRRVRAKEIDRARAAGAMPPGRAASSQPA